MNTPVKTVSVDLFYFDQLSEDAKERAIENYSRDFIDHDTGYITEDIESINKLIGIEFDDYDDGKPWIVYGENDAMFRGHHEYQKGCLHAIKGYAPTDKALHDIVRRLVELQLKNGYTLSGKITTQSTRYPGHHSQYAECWDRHGDEASQGTVNTFNKIMGDYAVWCGKHMQKAVDYCNSEEYAAEDMTTQGSLFTADGKFYE